MSARTIFAGLRFGGWTVLGPTHRRHVPVRCDCGATATGHRANLKKNRGGCRSCSVSAARREAPRAPTGARFWPKVDRSGGLGACWPWTGATGDRGYGHFWDGARYRHASRVAWILTHEDPGPLFVLHRCDNPPCCNPAHLFLGTHQDNMDDMTEKGRWRNAVASGPGCADAPAEKEH